MTTGKITKVGCAAIVLALASCTGGKNPNDFGQTMSFDGYFTDVGCGTGLTMFGASLAFGQDLDDDGVFTFRPALFVQLTNRTTGLPVPGAQGAIGSPVPTNGGVDIHLESLRIEYLLPQGELEPLEYAASTIIAPNGSTSCFGFFGMTDEHFLKMSNDPSSFPETPFNLTLRTTFFGTTEGGLEIQSQGEITVIITD